jgi:hypothetical protein
LHSNAFGRLDQKMVRGSGFARTNPVVLGPAIPNLLRTSDSHLLVLVPCKWREGGILKHLVVGSIRTLGLVLVVDSLPVSTSVHPNPASRDLGKSRQLSAE